MSDQNGKSKIAKHKIDDITKIWLTVCYWNRTVHEDYACDAEAIRRVLQEDEEDAQL